MKQNNFADQKNALSRKIAELSSEETEMKRNINSITSECAMLKSRIQTNSEMEQQNTG